MSCREAQIVEVLDRRGAATAAEVRARIPDPPGDSSIRTHLEILEERGHVAHRRDGRRYVYSPVLPPEGASASALRQVVATFFAGSESQLVAALLDSRDVKLTEEELERIQQMAAEAKRAGR